MYITTQTHKNVVYNINLDSFGINLIFFLEHCT